MPVPAQPLRTYTALDFITRALRLIGQLAEEETPSAAEATDSYAVLQELADTWQTQRLQIPTLLRTVTPLVSGKASYTIGIGGDINIVRPTEIEDARLLLDRTTPTPIETPLMILRDEQRADVRQKTFQGLYPTSLWFDHGWDAGLAGVWLYPIPTGTVLSSLVLYTPLAFTDFSTLTYAYSFPPGWAKMIRYTLAKALAPEYGRPWTGDLEDAASTSVADVKRLNTRVRELVTAYDVGRRGRYYNIWTDD